MSYRPMSNARRGVPMSSAGGSGQPPRTAMRTALTSSMGKEAAVGISIGKELNISDRPVTNQGMRGIKTASGPGRGVHDVGYFIGELRNKMKELTTEIGVLRKEVDGHKRDVRDYQSMDRRHEDLLGEVRELEGTLADYNLAMDKSRLGTDPADLESYVERGAAAAILLLARPATLPATTTTTPTNSPTSPFPGTSASTRPKTSALSTTSTPSFTRRSNRPSPSRGSSAR